MTTQTVNETEQTLAQFTGGGDYHRHFLGLVYTSGVEALAELCGAHWLIDAIASYQPKCRKDAMLHDFQIWTLEVDKSDPDRKYDAVLTCWRDTDDRAFQQRIEYTDFPLQEVKIIVERGGLDGERVDYIAMLPQER